ncbi:MAG: hypothetical protein IKQ47_02045 [Prevotella sp.]|nr:hypothetical protein [Prevotella sp.]
MKKIYSILFCLMAMSITFSSCSKGGDDDFLPNGGGTEVNGGSTQSLTNVDIEALNNAYNSGNTTTFINALESKGCIKKDDGTRGGDSDGKYELTDKGKEYFGHDMFKYIDDLEMAYDKMCLVFQGYWYDDKDDYIKHDTEYKWVSLDNPNNDYFEFSNNGVNYHSCLIIKNPRISNEEYRIYKDPDFDIYMPTYIKGEDGEFKLPVQNDGGLIFSEIMGTKVLVRSDGGKLLSPKDNNCIMHVSTFRPEDWGLYIRVPKTNK